MRANYDIYISESSGPIGEKRACYIPIDLTNPYGGYVYICRIFFD